MLNKDKVGVESASLFGSNVGVTEAMQSFAFPDPKHWFNPSCFVVFFYLHLNKLESFLSLSETGEAYDLLQYFVFIERTIFLSFLVYLSGKLKKMISLIFHLSRTGQKQYEYTIQYRYVTLPHASAQKDFTQPSKGPNKYCT
jgi:hypothetical protein